MIILEFYVAYVFQPRNDKFFARGKLCNLIGYPPTSKGCILYDLSPNYKSFLVEMSHVKKMFSFQIFFLFPLFTSFDDIEEDSLFYHFIHASSPIPSSTTIPKQIYAPTPNTELVPL